MSTLGKRKTLPAPSVVDDKETDNAIAENRAANVISE